MLIAHVFATFHLRNDAVTHTVENFVCVSVWACAFLRARYHHLEDIIIRQRCGQCLHKQSQSIKKKIALIIAQLQFVDKQKHIFYNFHYVKWKTIKCVVHTLLFVSWFLPFYQLAFRCVCVCKRIIRARHRISFVRFRSVKKTTRQHVGLWCVCGEIRWCLRDPWQLQPIKFDLECFDADPKICWIAFVATRFAWLNSVDKLNCEKCERSSLHWMKMFNVNWKEHQIDFGAGTTIAVSLNFRVLNYWTFLEVHIFRLRRQLAPEQTESRQLVHGTQNVRCVIFSIGHCIRLWIDMYIYIYITSRLDII